MRLVHEEFSCSPPVSPTKAIPYAPGHLVEDDGRGSTQEVATPLPVVVDEFEAAHELSMKIANSGLQNDAFLLANEDQLVANYTKWTKQFPKIQPYFGKL